MPSLPGRTVPSCKDLEQGRPHSQPTDQPTSPPNQPNQQTAQPTSMQSMSSVGMLVPQTSPSSAMLCRQRSAPTRSDVSRSPPEIESASKRVDADVPLLHGRNSRDPIVRSVALTSFFFSNVYFRLFISLVFLSFYLTWSIVSDFSTQARHMHTLVFKSAIHKIIRNVYQEYSPPFSGLYVTMKY